MLRCFVFIGSICLLGVVTKVGLFIWDADNAKIRYQRFHEWIEGDTTYTVDAISVSIRDDTVTIRTPESISFFRKCLQNAGTIRCGQNIQFGYSSLTTICFSGKFDVLLWINISPDLNSLQFSYPIEGVNDSDTYTVSLKGATMPLDFSELMLKMNR